MRDLVELVRAYAPAKEPERMQLAEVIFSRIAPDLELFVLSRIDEDSAQDALQEVLKAIAMNLQEFRGRTTKEFWQWCYRICHYKINDHFRNKYKLRTQPLPPDDSGQTVELSDDPISAAVRMDLEYAMELLKKSKPECLDFLWKYFVVGLDYDEIALERSISYENARKRIGRCLQTAKSLVS